MTETPWKRPLPPLAGLQGAGRGAAGVNILSVRETKPSIPASISANFKAMEEERTKELIAQARERVVTREAEIERTRAVMQVPPGPCPAPCCAVWAGRGATSSGRRVQWLVMLLHRVWLYMLVPWQLPGPEQGTPWPTSAVICS